MNNKTIVPLPVFVVAFYGTDQPHTHLLFFRPYPVDEVFAQELMHGLNNPHTLSHHMIKGLAPHNYVAGIFSTYFGYLQVSTYNGQVTYPRKQSTAKLHIVVTNKITPIVMFRDTISHWELEPGVAAQIYSLEQKEDEDTKLIYWDVQNKAIPENNQISPIDSIVIIAKPENIYLPTGISLAKRDPNLILPDIYVRKTIHSLRNALYMVNLTPFFSPVNILYKQSPLMYQTLVQE